MSELERYRAAMAEVLEGAEIQCASCGKYKRCAFMYTSGNVFTICQDCINKAFEEPEEDENEALMHNAHDRNQVSKLFSRQEAENA